MTSAPQAPFSSQRTNPRGPRNTAQTPFLPVGTSSPAQGRSSNNSARPNFTPNAFEPSNMSAAVGGPPPAHGHSDSVNGRNATNTSIPSVGGPTIVNGNTPFTPSEHNRKPSMTVTPAGTTGFAPNSGAVGGAQNKSNIVFGSVNTAGSPAMGTPVGLANQSSSNLSVSSLNPRISSPQNSPSPIPQPVSASGGKPPSTFQAQGNVPSFGQFGSDGSDPNGLNRPMSQMQLGPQQDHMRRGSTQSTHSDMGGTGMPTGPVRGGFPSQGGRGRGYPGSYQQPMPYSGQNFRPPNNRAMQSGYHGQNRQQAPYPNSPSLGTRSPAMMNANPGTPQMNQMHMVPGMAGQHNGYQYMGPHQGFPIQSDPSIQQMYAMNQGQWMMQQPQMQNQYQNYMPPQSPRPPFSQGPHAPYMQPTYSGQGQPPSMSRQSSQMSGPDRPGSSIGQNPTQTQGTTLTTNTPSHSSTRAPSVSLPPSTIIRPQKKSAAIQIKTPQGEVVNIPKPSTHPSQTVPKTSTPPIPSTSTPPVENGPEAIHARPEGVNVKSDEEKKKAMQEAVAAKLKQEQDEIEAKAQKEKEVAEAEAKEKDALKAKEEAQAREKEAEEAKAKEAKEAAEAAEAAEAEAAEAAKAAEAARIAEAEKEKAVEVPAPVEAKAPTPPPQKADEDEIDYDALEAEYAAMEAEEARREAEYAAKKKAAREAARKREEEEEAAYEATLKEKEREADEQEAAEREKALSKKKADGESDDELSKNAFASLKHSDAPTPPSHDSPIIQTPVESGAVTPVSDAPMPPPARVPGPNKRKVTELTLNTSKAIEPPEPSATLKSLKSARLLDDPTKVDYPSGIQSPNPALNANAPADRKFKYNKEFLLQFQEVFKEKPSLDWDAKIREALGDGESSTTSARPSGSARTPSSMGGRSVSNRPAAANVFNPMGTFGAPPRAGPTQLPPGTTSEQRFALSNASGMAAGRNPTTNNPFAFGRPPGMPMSAQMSRTASNNPLAGIPASPRVGGSTRGGSRNESKRNKQSTKQMAEENKSMPLTAGMDVGPIQVSASGWKPRSIGAPSLSGPALGGDGLMAPDVVQRKVKASLNKMTPEKFDKISDQILEIAAQSKDESDGRTLRQVIQLTFEKATDEAHWAPMYAMFCKRMLESMSPDIKDENIKDKNGNIVTGGNLFRKYLLNRCQEEFERGWKINLPPRADGQTEEAALLSDDYYIAAAAKRRGLGLVKFIGELFKLGMLTERIMHECVKKLLDYEGVPDEAEVESLTSLLRTVGANLDNSESKAQPRMAMYFERIQQIMAMPELPSRLRFMLLDVVDLRRNNWHSKEDNKGPKTIQEIHLEAERAAREAEAQRLISQANRGGRMPMGRGDARSFSTGYGQMPPPDNSNRVGTDDLRRLGTRMPRNPSSAGGPGSLGPPSLMGGRTNSGRKGLGPGSLLARGEESANSSRTGTPPIQKEKEKKDESSTNAFSALAALEGQEGPASPPSNASSPPTQKSQPNVERERSKSPDKSKE